MSAAVRLLLVLGVLAVMAWTWWAGEKLIRRHLPGVNGNLPLAKLFVGLWRLLMIAVSAVAVVSVVGLWAAQDAGQRGQEAGEQAERVSRAVAVITTDLCENNRAWQIAALGIREADVRIVRAEVSDADAEVADAETAIVEAKATGEYDNEFVGPYLERDLARANVRQRSLLAEQARRQDNYDELAGLALEECPPGPEDGD